jgi:CheY-like chemotaxis protein
MTSARKIILVVDDDPGVLDYASNVLEECGYTVLTAPDGATALVLLRDHPQVDLLFTDVVMPGLDGVEVARRARQESPGLKVLFTSGYAADVVPAGRLLKKPYRPSSPERSPQWSASNHKVAHRVAKSAIATISTGQNSPAEKATATSENSIVSSPLRRSSTKW